MDVAGFWVVQPVEGDERSSCILSAGLYFKAIFNCSGRGDIRTESPRSLGNADDIIPDWNFTSL